MDSKELLKKFGWKEGQGLGKCNDGMTQPIKAFIKQDNTGVGFKPSDDFTNEWWCKAFNKASKSISIENNSDSVVIKNRKRKKSDKLESSNEASKCKYGNFVDSTEVYHNGQTHCTSKKKKVYRTEKSKSPSPKSSQSDLFSACEGRTAHKMARHGIKLSGKLKRLQNQDHHNNN